LRAFIVIGAAVAIFWAAAFYFIGSRMAHTGETAACRNEQILLAVSKNQNTIGEVKLDGNDLVITTDWRHWMALDLQRRKDIAMAAWCVVAHEGKGGIVRVMSGDTEFGRVEKGKWMSKFGG
jgi:hypothetical protein